MSEKKLYKDKANAKLSGVIAGLANITGIDVGTLRLLFVGLVIFTGGFPGVFFYIIAAIVLDDKPTSIEQ